MSRQESAAILRQWDLRAAQRIAARYVKGGKQKQQDAARNIRQMITDALREVPYEERAYVPLPPSIMREVEAEQTAALVDRAHNRKRSIRLG